MWCDQNNHFQCGFKSSLETVELYVILFYNILHILYKFHHLRASADWTSDQYNFPGYTGET